MKKGKKILAVLLSLIIACSFGLTAFANSDNNAGRAYSPFVKIIDNLFGTIHDLIFGFVEKATLQKDIPSYEEYISQEHDYFYNGTQSTVTGDSWSAGFAKNSIIPTKWRVNADGKQDDNGYNFKSSHPTGGYQTYVNKMYTDQMMNMVIMSNGSDSNGNGIDDLLIFVSIDCVGVTAGTCADIRKNIEIALAEYGVTKEDILGINISSTHCHAALDTQGMCIPTLFLNRLNPLTDFNRSVNIDIERSICLAAGICAKNAYDNIQDGSLYFFETDKVNGASDKLHSGVKTKNYFSCFLFEGDEGEKTILSNIGAHPTSYGAWDNNKMMCADYPYFMALALADEGYNIVFTQSSQANVSSPSIDYQEGDEKDIAASEWLASHALSREDWSQRYGESYTEKWYDSLEEKMNGHMKKGFLLAQHILNAIDKTNPVAPSLKVKNAQSLLTLDHGVMAWGATSGLLGENVVSCEDSETGYGIMVETNYLEIGEDVAILTCPGELSPAIFLGTDENYDGTALWTGKTSWTGEDWKYDTVTDIVRNASGDSDKTVLLFGITNDAIGYMYADIDNTKSLLGALLFYKESPADMTNSMLMTVGTRVGSQIVEGYLKLLG